MGWVLGNYGCVEASDLLTACNEAEPPMPIEAWFGLANRFALPRGPEWGTGAVLMRRADLVAIDINNDVSLKIDDGNKNFTLKKLVITDSPQCVTPSYRSAAESIYFVPLADRRYNLAKIPIDKAYNVRSGSGYVIGTTNGGFGTPWTWQDLVNDLATPLGINPLTLPYTPNGTPNDFRFYRGSAWAALNTVLDACSMAVCYDPIADTFKIVEVGAFSSTTASALNSADANREWESDPVVPTYGRLPEKVRVYFSWSPVPADGTSPYYTVDVSPTGVTTALPGSTIEWVAGGTDALGVPPAAPTNAAALATRAAEVAAKYYQRLISGTDPLLRRYVGVISDTALRPNEVIQAVVWQDLGEGYLTEVYRGPVPRPPVAVPPAIPGSLEKLFRITDTFYTDASGWMYWPIIDQTYTPAAGPPPFADVSSALTIDTGGAGAKPFTAWLTSPYQYIDFVPTDGSGFRVALSEDVSYDPTGGAGVNSSPPGNYSAPVYVSTQYQALRAVRCNVGTIDGDLGG